MRTITLLSLLAVAACTTGQPVYASAARDAELIEAASDRAEAQIAAKCLATGYSDRDLCLRAFHDARRRAR